MAKTISLIGQVSDIDISQAEINFVGSDFPILFTKIIYTTQGDRFILRNNEFKVSPGEKYLVKAWLPESGIDTIRAETTVLEPLGLDNAEILELKEIVINDELSHYETVLSISFEQPSIQLAYFQLNPFRFL